MKTAYKAFPAPVVQSIGYGVIYVSEYDIFTSEPDFWTLVQLLRTLT